MKGDNFNLKIVIIIGLSIVISALLVTLFYKDIQLKKITLQLDNQKEKNIQGQKDSELFEMKLRCKDIGEKELEKWKKKDLGIEADYFNPEFRYSKFLNTCILIFEQRVYPKNGKPSSAMRAIRLDTNEQLVILNIDSNDDYIEKLKKFWQEFNKQVPE